MIESQFKSLNPDNMKEALKVFMRCIQEIDVEMIAADQLGNLFTLFDGAIQTQKALGD